MRYFFYIFVLFSFLNCKLSYSQTTELIPITEQEAREQSIIPRGNQNPEKIMACSGNAANDNFANAQTLVVNGGNVAGTTCGTMESGETNACYTAGTNSVWYKFTATSTTHYVQIAHTSGGCYFGSAVYASSTLPTSACGNTGPISCQSASGGPLTHLYHLTNLTIGATYYIQVMYGAGGVCGQNATFNIQVTTANPGGTITNRPPLAQCTSPGTGCFFGSPPTVNTVTSTCTSYPLSAAGYGANSVWSTVIQFTSSASWSNFSWQAIITSNCGGGNVVWLNWTLYDCSCNQIACGNISTLTGAGLSCATCFRLKYEMELANCSSFTTIWPYQNVPSSPTPCTILPLHLLYFTAYPNKDKRTVSLEWEAIAEIDLKEYKVERSDDGINFKPLSIIQAKGTDNGNQKYSYEDACCTGAETRYYKLSSIDNNGSLSYEKIVAVSFDAEKEIAKFSPNPANDNFIISFGESAQKLPTRVQVISANGNVVIDEEFVTDTFFKQFNIESLSSGIYFIRLTTPASPQPLNYKLSKQ